MQLVKHDLWCSVCEKTKKKTRIPHSFAVEKTECNSIHTWRNTLWMQRAQVLQQKTTHQSSGQLSGPGSSVQEQTQDCSITVQFISMSWGQLQHQLRKVCPTFDGFRSAATCCQSVSELLTGHAASTILLFSVGRGRWRIQGPASTRPLLDLKLKMENKDFFVAFM